MIVALTTPMRAAGEELMFRGAILPAAASWIRAVRPALALGIGVSRLAFVVVHGSSDRWLAAYYVVFSVSTGLMMIISRGLEAPIAFHVANNVLTTTLNTIFADGGAFGIDRSAGAAGLSLGVLTAVNIALVLLVWRRSGGDGGQPGECPAGVGVADPAVRAWAGYPASRNA